MSAEDFSDSVRASPTTHYYFYMPGERAPFAIADRVSVTERRGKVEIVIDHLLANPDAETSSRPVDDVVLEEITVAVDIVDKVRKKFLDCGWSWESAEQAAIEMFKEMVRSKE